MRTLCYALLLIALLMTVAPAAAQQDTPNPEPAPALPMDEALARAEALLAAVEEAAARAEDRVEDAEKQVDYAFNLLGLFEALGIVLTLVGGVAAAFGITRLFSAQNDLTEARKRFEEEMAASRKRLDDETAAKQAEINMLRDELLRSTSNATLALSYLPLGERQYKSGDFSGAIDIYERALHLDQHNPIIHYRLGYVYTQSGKLEMAIHHLHQALKIDTDFAPALAVLGYAYRRMGEKMGEGIERDSTLNDAERYLLQALNRSQKLVDEEGESWWGSLGGLYRRRGQVDQAIYAYKRASEVVPTSSYAFSNLALLYMQQNQRDLMIQTYRDVEKLAENEVRADVDNYWAYADLLTARLALGHMNGIDTVLDKLLTTAPTDSPYALESLTDTLTRLSVVMEAQKAETIRAYIDRIRAFVQKTHTAAQGG